MLHRCRPAGAQKKMVSLSSIQISPRSEIKIHYANNKRFLIRVIRVICVNPRFRQLIHIARWGNQSSVCSRAIYRTFFLGERRTHRACLLPCIASTVGSYRRTATSGQESGFGDPSYKKGSQQSGISGWEISAGAQWDLLSRKTGEVGKPRQQNGKICCEEQITASVRKGQVAEVCSPA